MSQKHLLKVIFKCSLCSKQAEVQRKDNRKVYCFDCFFRIKNKTNPNKSKERRRKFMREYMQRKRAEEKKNES